MCNHFFKMNFQNGPARSSDNSEDDPVTKKIDKSDEIPQSSSDQKAETNARQRQARAENKDQINETAEIDESHIEIAKKDEIL